MGERREKKRKFREVKKRDISTDIARIEECRTVLCQLEEVGRNLESRKNLNNQTFRATLKTITTTGVPQVNKMVIMLVITQADQLVGILVVKKSLRMQKWKNCYLLGFLLVKRRFTIKTLCHLRAQKKCLKSEKFQILKKMNGLSRASFKSH